MFWRRLRRPWRRDVSYVLIGALLACGSPSGYLVVGWIHSGFRWTLQDFYREAQSDPLTYGYLFGSTFVVSTLLGWLIGRKEEALHQSSITDPLTGLCNRRYFCSRLREEFARAWRYHSPLSLMLVDLDRLKMVNDGWGHETGDAALCAIAGVLRDTCRVTDVAARYGGDEFAVLLPSTTAIEAGELAERIRRRVEALELIRRGETLPLSVSIGVADLHHAEVSHPDSMLAAADAALYHAKDSGRDTVVMAGEEDYRPRPQAGQDTDENRAESATQHRDSTPSDTSPRT